MATRRLLSIERLGLDTDETFFKLKVNWQLEETLAGRLIQQQIRKNILATDLNPGELAQMNAAITMISNVLERLDPLEPAR